MFKDHFFRDLGITSRELYTVKDSFRSCKRYSTTHLDLELDLSLQLLQKAEKQKVEKQKAEKSKQLTEKLLKSITH